MQDPIGKDIFMPKILPQLLAGGLLKANELKVLKEGTMVERAEVGLNLLRNNQVSGQKIVVEIAW